MLLTSRASDRPGQKSIANGVSVSQVSATLTNDRPSGSTVTDSTLTVSSNVRILSAVPSVHSMIGMHVSHNIRQKILKVSILTLPFRSGGDEKKLIFNKLGKIISKDAKSKKVDTIEQETDLMFIFAGVYRNDHPARALELLKYMQSIRMGANRGQFSGKYSMFKIVYERHKI